MSRFHPYPHPPMPQNSKCTDKTKGKQKMLDPCTKKIHFKELPELPAMRTSM